MADRYNAHVQVSKVCKFLFELKFNETGKCVAYARLFTHMCVLFTIKKNFKTKLLK